MASSNDDDVLRPVREEFAKYIDRKFDDHEDFQTDLNLASDDLTAIALAVERKLKIKVDRRLYFTIHTVAEFAQLIRNFR